MARRLPFPFSREAQPMRVRIFCLAAGLWLLAAAPVFADDTEDKAVRLIEKVGGAVRRNEEAPGKPVTAVYTGNCSLMGDYILREMVALTEVEEIDLMHTGISDDGLKSLAGLKKLQRLSLYGTVASDAGMKELSELTRLRSLTLDRTKVTDDGLK